VDSLLRDAGGSVPIVGIRYITGENDNAFIVWGAEAIGAVINKRRRPAFYLLESGRLPAKKIGGQWAASRRALISHISGEAE